MNPTLQDAEKLAKVQVLAANVNAKFPKVPQLSASDCMKLLKGEQQQAGAASSGSTSTDKIYLVDCRTEDEMDVSIIKGAMSLDHFKSEEVPKDETSKATVVCYCTIGFRSSICAEKLISTKGNKGSGSVPSNWDVFNMSGSALAWVHEGGELVTRIDGEATKTLHCYAPNWAWTPLAYDNIVFPKTSLMKEYSKYFASNFWKLLSIAGRSLAFSNKKTNNNGDTATSPRI
jgi:rhodanese-related sulfurtransferase